jgi:hypothetical protein
MLELWRLAPPRAECPRPGRTPEAIPTTMQLRGGPRHSAERRCRHAAGTEDLADRQQAGAGPGRPHPAAWVARPREPGEQRLSSPAHASDDLRWTPDRGACILVTSTRTSSAAVMVDSQPPASQRRPGETKLLELRDELRRIPDSIVEMLGLSTAVFDQGLRTRQKAGTRASAQGQSEYDSPVRADAADGLKMLSPRVESLGLSSAPRLGGGTPAVSGDSIALPEQRPGDKRARETFNLEVVP